MKKRSLKSLNLKKRSISVLQNRSLKIANHLLGGAATGYQSCRNWTESCKCHVKNPPNNPINQNGGSIVIC